MALNTKNSVVNYFKTLVFRFPEMRFGPVLIRFDCLWDREIRRSSWGKNTRNVKKRDEDSIDWETVFVHGCSFHLF